MLERFEVFDLRWITIQRRVEADRCLRLFGLFLALALSLTAPVSASAAPTRLSENEAKAIAAICKKHQILDVIKDQVYRLPSPDQKTSYLVPSRNRWLKPATLEIQVVERSRVVAGLAPPLWKFERVYRFQSLDQIHFRDLDSDGRSDFVLDIRAMRPEGGVQRIFALYVADAKGGFELKDSLLSDPRSLPSISDFLGVSGKQLRERGTRDALQKPALSR